MSTKRGVFQLTSNPQCTPHRIPGGPAGVSSSFTFSCSPHAVKPSPNLAWICGPHILYGGGLFTLDIFPDATFIWALGPAIWNTLACAIPVAREETGIL